MAKPTHPLKNNRGIAMLIALFSMGIMVFIAMEVSYETNVEYVIASKQVNRIKAYYAAKSGVELSLLRVLLYKKAIAQFGDQIGDNKSMLDPIWNFPFAWPPSNFIPKDDLTIVARGNIESAEKDSLMDATYITTIESEGGKIDINDLGSDVESLRKSVRAQLAKIFEIQIETNEEFADKYGSYNFEELINNIQDWVDEDNESLNGGDEKSAYSKILDEPSDFIPANAAFKRLEELHMVAGMKDDFFDLLKSRITVYGIKGINVNYASAETLKSLDAQIDDEVAKDIIARRNSPERGGPFQDQEDFENFLSTLINTGPFNEAQIPLLFDPVYNFRIISTGEFAGSSREIVAVTYDIDGLTGRVVELLDKQEDEKSGSNTDNNDDGNKTTNSKQDQDPVDSNNKKDESKKVATPEGKPRIVYWQED